MTIPTVGSASIVVEIVIGPAAGFGGQPVGRLRHGIETGDKLRAFRLFDRMGMEPRDHSAADDAETVGHETLPLLGFTMCREKANDSRLQ